MLNIIWNIVEYVFELIARIIIYVILSTIQFMVNEIRALFVCDFQLLETYFPVVKETSKVFVIIGLMLILLIFMWQVFRNFGAGIIGDTEDPVILLLKTVPFTFMIFQSRAVCSMFMKIASALTEMMWEVPLAWDGSTFTLNQNIFNWDAIATEIGSGGTSLITPHESTSLFNSDAANVNLTDGFGKLCALLLVLTFLIAIAWNFIKLVIEIGERYIVMCILYWFSPLAFAMGPSNSTNAIFKGWCRMFASSLFMMVMNTWCILMTVSGLQSFVANSAATDQIHYYTLDASGTFVQNGTVTGNMLTWAILLLAFLKSAQSLDEYLNAMGLSTARTGRGLLDDAMMVTRSLTSAAMMGGRAIDKLKGAAGSGGRGGAGANGKNANNTIAASSSNAGMGGVANGTKFNNASFNAKANKAQMEAADGKRKSAAKAAGLSDENIKSANLEAQKPDANGVRSGVAKDGTKLSMDARGNIKTANGDLRTKDGSVTTRGADGSRTTYNASTGDITKTSADGKHRSVQMANGASMSYDGNAHTLTKTSADGVVHKDFMPGSAEYDKAGIQSREYDPHAGTLTTTFNDGRAPVVSPADTMNGPVAEMNEAAAQNSANGDEGENFEIAGGDAAPGTPDSLNQDYDGTAAEIGLDKSAIDNAEWADKGDGSGIQTASVGDNTLEKSADGSSINAFGPDGNKLGTLDTASGALTVPTDNIGGSTTLNPDGSKTFTQPNGTNASINADGFSRKYGSDSLECAQEGIASQSYDKASGTITTTGTDGRVTTCKAPADTNFGDRESIDSALSMARKEHNTPANLSNSSVTMGGVDSGANNGNAGVGASSNAPDSTANSTVAMGSGSVSDIPANSSAAKNNSNDTTVDTARVPAGASPVNASSDNIPNGVGLASNAGGGANNGGGSNASGGSNAGNSSTIPTASSNDSAQADAIADAAAKIAQASNTTNNAAPSSGINYNAGPNGGNGGNASGNGSGNGISNNGPAYNASNSKSGVPGAETPSVAQASAIQPNAPAQVAPTAAHQAASPVPQGDSTQSSVVPTSPSTSSRISDNGGNVNAHGDSNSNVGYSSAPSNNISSQNRSSDTVASANGGYDSNVERVAAGVAIGATAGSMMPNGGSDTATTVPNTTYSSNSVSGSGSDSSSTSNSYAAAPVAESPAASVANAPSAVGNDYASAAPVAESSAASVANAPSAVGNDYASAAPVAESSAASVANAPSAAGNDYASAAPVAESSAASVANAPSAVGNDYASAAPVAESSAASVANAPSAAGNDYASAAPVAESSAASVANAPSAAGNDYASAAPVAAEYVAPIDVGGSSGAGSDGVNYDSSSNSYAAGDNGGNTPSVGYSVSDDAGDVSNSSSVSVDDSPSVNNGYSASNDSEYSTPVEESYAAASSGNSYSPSTDNYDDVGSSIGESASSTTAFVEPATTVTPESTSDYVPDNITYPEEYDVTPEYAPTANYGQRYGDVPETYSTPINSTEVVDTPEPDYDSYYAFGSGDGGNYGGEGSGRGDGSYGSGGEDYYGGGSGNGSYYDDSESNYGGNDNGGVDYYSGSNSSSNAGSGNASSGDDTAQAVPQTTTTADNASSYAPTEVVQETSSTPVAEAGDSYIAGQYNTPYVSGGEAKAPIPDTAFNASSAPSGDYYQGGTDSANYGNSNAQSSSSANAYAAQQNVAPAANAPVQQAPAQAPAYNGNTGSQSGVQPTVVTTPTTTQSSVQQAQAPANRASNEQGRNASTPSQSTSTTEIRHTTTKVENTSQSNGIPSTKANRNNGGRNNAKGHNGGRNSGRNNGGKKGKK